MMVQIYNPRMQKAVRGQPGLYSKAFQKTREKERKKRKFVWKIFVYPSPSTEALFQSTAVFRKKVFVYKFPYCFWQCWGNCFVGGQDRSVCERRVHGC